MSTTEILQILRRYKAGHADMYGIMRLGLFGSAARNEMGPGSDIDVVVDLKKPDLFHMVHIKDDLEKEYGQKVDIVHYRASMNPFLKKRIDRDAIYA